MKYLINSALAASLLLASLPAFAATTWTDWTSATANTAQGTIGSVGVSLSSTSNFFGVQTAGGTDFWVPWFDAALRPTGSDIIQLGAAGVRTITFTVPVTNVAIAFNSWNAAGTTSFDKNFTVIGSGRGFWGIGTFNNVSANSFTSVARNEIHGILQFAGPISSLTMTDPFENWHGFSVGIGGIASVVPEPASWAMLITGFGLVGASLRTRRRSIAA